MKEGTVILLLLLSTQLVRAQDHFQSGELKGFTKSAAESIVIHLEQPFIVKEVSGTVLRSVGDESPLNDALFELRGPGNSVTIKSAKTNADGSFQISGVSPGRYLFKSTALGFQSIVGKVIVSPKAGPTHTITLRMRPGV
jgi:hypothetical protein